MTITEQQADSWIVKINEGDRVIPRIKYAIQGLFELIEYCNECDTLDSVIVSEVINAHLGLIRNKFDKEGI